MSDARPAARRRMGRTPLPPEVRLAQVVYVRFRVRDSAYDALCARAAVAGKSLPEVAREMVMAGLSVTNP